MSWVWVGVGFAVLAVVFMVYPALIAGRRDDAEHGRLEEQVDQ